MGIMDQLRTACEELVYEQNIKPSLLVVGSSQYRELCEFMNHSTLSSFWLEDLRVDDYTISVLAVSAENHFVLYGNQHNN